MKTNKPYWSVVWDGVFITLALTSLLPACGAEYSWRASWGVFPDQVDPSVKLWNTNTIAPVRPVLAGTDLIIQTPAQFDGLADNYMYYDYTNLTMPTQLVIEAEVQCVSGNSAKAGRPYVAISFTTGSGVGGLLGIEPGEIYLSLNQAVRGWTAAVNTDDASHLYRIEADTPSVTGSPIRVYQDGMLVMTGAIAANSAPANNWGSVPDIWFGEGTDWAYGISRWRSFRHNAAAVPSGPVIFINSTPDEVRWTSHTNVLYNLQHSTNLTTGAWTNLATNVLGNGTTNSVTETLRHTTPQGFYRVQMLQ